MSEDVTIEPQDRFEINPLYLFRWEETQDAYVLLYPEGVVKLNETAGEILKRCTGEVSVTEIIDELKERFSARGPHTETSVETSVHKFLEVSQAKGWIKRKADG
ncbi:MAG: pyrroloquinoline quinone biosynthesis peptide chaperone PqqD [Alphaproteobacteria bacterium]